MAEPEVIAESQLREAVGPRADYYLRAWEPDRVRYNWAAFCWTGLWLAYRKMYWQASVLFGAIVLESLLETLVFDWWLGHPAPRSLDRGLTIGLACTFGRFGNQFYRRHVEGLVRSTNAKGKEFSAAGGTLAKRGGTSLLAAVVAFVLFTVAIVGSLTLLDFALPSSDEIEETVPARGNG